MSILGRKEKVQVDVVKGKYCVKKSFSLDITYTTARHIIEQLQKLLDEAVAHGEDDVHVEVETVEEYGSTFLSSRAYYYRAATTEEIAEYQAEQEKIKEEREARERKHFEELKKKYGK